MAKMTVKTSMQVEFTPKQLGEALYAYLLERVDVDDAACDWYTDDKDNVFISADPDWNPIRNNPELAALVDAMNFLRYGKILKMELS